MSDYFSRLSVLIPQHQVYWYGDLLASNLSSINQAEAISAVKQAEFLVCVDAKKLMNQLKLTAQSSIRLICLNTIKKLVADHSQELSPPVLEPGQLLIWVNQQLTAFLDQIEQHKLQALTALECQVLPALIAMEQAGLAFNQSAWQAHLTAYAKEIAQIKPKLEAYLSHNQGFALFGPETIDLNNNNTIKQALEKLLNTKLLGTSSSSLGHIDHEAVRLLLRYRECSRMLNTYGDNFLAHIDNNRIYASFVPQGSSSGRMACLKPNLQALPSDPAFQGCLRAPPGYQVLRFDYGAFELRILAGLSQDQALLKIFNDQLDLHAMVAEAVFNTKVSKSEHSHLRDQAKILNFGIIYGMGERALAAQLKISVSQAQKLMSQYFTKFARVKQFLDGLEEQAQKLGYAQTSLGRRVYLSRTDQDQGHNMRIARNMPIQGTGAEIIKLAMIRVFKALDQHKLKASLVNMIHDELVIECQDHQAREVRSLVKAEMIEAFNAMLPNVSAEVSVSYET